MDVSTPGNLLILLAFVFNNLTGIFFFLVARGNRSYESLAVKSYHVFTVCVALAVAYLYYLFYTHNFAIQYVFEYSDRSLSFFYILSSFWAGQEGTYLLWLFFNALLGYIIIYKAGIYKNYGMVIYASVNLFFLVILWKLSPFALLDFVPQDGSGLNPLLQDPWMVIHPPIIFIGYSMSAIPFAIALAALIKNKYSDLIKKIFPWVAITSLMLAAGNILGGYWAYKTLGWGGYWAWDPVENSSFVPWFTSLALIHGLLIEKHSGALKKINILLTSFIFILIIYGTFLTRSGVLADFSVHSFVDLGINQYLVGFLIFYLVLTLILFIPRIKAIGHSPLNYNYYNKEFLLFMGMTLLFTLSMVVLFWTSLPILSVLFSETPRAADISTYNYFALPLAVIFALFLTVSPYVNYNSYVPRNWNVKLVTTLAVSVIIGFGLFYFVFDTSVIFSMILTLVMTGIGMYMFKSDLLKTLLPALLVFLATVLICLLLDINNYMFILLFASAAMVMTTNLMTIFGYLPGRWDLMGGQLTHLGFGLMLIGVVASTAFTTNEKLVLERGTSKDAFGLSITYNGMEHNIEFPKNKLLLTYIDDGETYDAYPQLYYSPKLDGIMKKPFVLKKALYDLYFSPEQIQELNENQGLILGKGESKIIEDYEFTFVDFEMNQHDSDSGLIVTAQVNLKQKGNMIQLEPALRIITNPNGNETINVPAEFGDEKKYSLTIKQILADRGVVAFDIPGLIQTDAPDQLVLDISKKPVINLVWIGTALILLGCIIVYIRRKTELNR
ncbi:MAG: cytochrome c biogenesis protein CcsA [Candidatus Zixiibacteriota bacterium]